MSRSIRRHHRFRIRRKRLLLTFGNKFYQKEPSRVLTQHPLSCDCSKSNQLHACKEHKAMWKKKKYRRIRKHIPFEDYD